VLTKAQSLRDIFKGEIKVYVDFIQNAKLENIPIDEIINMYLEQSQLKK